MTIDGNVSSFADLSELGLSYDSGNGQLQLDPSGVPLFQSLTSMQSAELVVSFTVDDGSLTDTGSLTLLVSGVNDAPVALDPDLGSATDEDTLLTQQLGVDLALDLFGTDVDSPLTTASFAFTSAEVTIDGNMSSFADLSELGLSYDGGTGQLQLDPSGVPLFQSLPSTQSAELVVSFTVDDGSLTDTGNLTLLVSGVNDAPVALDPDLGVGD